MIYTTYISNINNIPDNTHKVLVTRFKPKSLDCDRLGLRHIQLLSPSEGILKSYKNNEITFDQFTEKFLHEINNNSKAGLELYNIQDKLDKGENVCFICYEKDPEICHRTILRKSFEILGYKGEEI